MYTLTINTVDEVSYTIFNMILFALKNSVLNLLIASIVIGVSAIILSIFFHKNKIRDSIACIIMIGTNIIIWFNVNKLSENVLEVSQDPNWQRYLILIFLMISFGIIGFNNIPLVSYLFNHPNYSKSFNDSTKRFLYIVLPLPIFFIIKWIIVDNGYLHILDFLSNL